MRKLRGARRSGCEWDPPAGVWTDYGERNSYSDEDAARKEDFVRDAVAGRARRRLVWDIGANNGRYSRIAAERAAHGGWRSTPTRRRSSCSTASCATRATSASCR